jgi:hypothetical protein
MMTSLLKLMLPDRPVPVRILRGPFRGARMVMNPRHSLRKIFGIYECELNPWLEWALSHVNRVVDVGANDGYFTFGCAAAFRRLGKSGEIIGIENQERHILELQRSIEEQGRSDVAYQLVQAYAGREPQPGYMTLDSLHFATGGAGDRTCTLIKIDVEGAELDVVEGGLSWIQPTNRFLIEVHEERFLSRLKVLFAERGHKLVQVTQRPHPILGPESRSGNNWWLVTDPGSSKDQL